MFKCDPTYNLYHRRMDYILT